MGLNDDFLGRDGDSTMTSFCGNHEKYMDDLLIFIEVWIVIWWGFNMISWFFYLMGFNGDSMGFNRDLIGI